MPLIVSCVYLGKSFENRNFNRKKQILHTFYLYVIEAIIFTAILLTAVVAIYEISFATSLHSSIGLKI